MFGEPDLTKSNRKGSGFRRALRLRWQATGAWSWCRHGPRTSKSCHHRHDPVAWDDDGEWVAPESLADRPGIVGPEPGCDLAVGQHAARRNAAGNLVDAAVEVRHALHVQGHCGQIARFALQQSRHVGDDALDVRRGEWLRRCRESVWRCGRASWIDRPREAEIR